MFKYFNLRNSVLQRVILSLFVFSGIAAPLAAQPTWSGNASVDPAEFVNFIDDIPLAGASSSFTRNTVVLVTNPQNNKTVEITIVKRAPRPGVFLVLSEEAGMALSMPSDQVVPVQVQVADTIGNEYDEFKSVDPDINPAVSVPAEEAGTGEESASAAAVESPAPEEAVPEVSADFTTAPGFSYDEPVPVPLPGDNLRVDRTVTDEITEELPEETGDEEVFPAAVPTENDLDVLALAPLGEDFPVPETSAEALPEAADESLDFSDVENLSDSLLPSGDNVIYFLTPSDFRPPTHPVAGKEESEEIIPVLVDRDALEDYIVNQLNNGSSYIQLGAYSTAESIYNEIEAIEARYPMVVWTERKNGLSLYKLLIGPLTQDETGVLSYRFRDSGYADLFLYKP